MTDEREAELTALLTTALRYLEHPDVEAAVKRCVIPGYEICNRIRLSLNMTTTPQPPNPPRPHGP